MWLMVARCSRINQEQVNGFMIYRVIQIESNVENVKFIGGSGGAVG